MIQQQQDASQDDTLDPTTGLPKPAQIKLPTIPSTIPSTTAPTAGATAAQQQSLMASATAPTSGDGAPNLATAAGMAMSPAAGQAAMTTQRLTPPATATDTTPSIPGVPTVPATGSATGSTSAVLPATPSATLPNPGGIVPTTPIDPTNDLRSTSVLPTSTPALDSARTGLIGATGALSSFDRVGTLQSLLSQFGIDSPDVQGGPAVNAGPSEQGALDTLNSQASGAAGKVAGYDRNTDMAGLRDALTKYFGNTDVQAGPSISTDPSARLSSYNSLLDDSAGKLAGVDRVALAKDMLSQFDDSQLPEHALALKQLTDQYAARGGGRSGMLRTAYGNEDLVRQRDRDAMKKSLISSALEGTIQDQFNKTNALAGLQSSTAAQDAGVRGEQRTDRGYQTDVSTGNVNRGLSTRQAAAGQASSDASQNYDTLSGALSQLGNQQGATAAREAARRGEQRTERDTATGLQERNATRKLSAADSNRSFAGSVADAAAGDAATRTSAASNLFNTLTNEGQANRAETRGERGYQNQLEADSYGRALTQQELERQQQNQSLQQELAMLGAGEAGNPSSTLTSLANGSSGLDPQLIAALAQSLGQRGTSTPAAVPGASLPIPTGIQLPDYGGILS